MELIKNNYQKIISYSLIIIGVIASAIIFLINPQQTAIQNLGSFNKKDSKITEVQLPFTQKYTLATTNPSFLELYLGENTTLINHKFQVSVKNQDEVIFEHKYTNEQSNIIRLPISGHNLNIGDGLLITISSQEISKTNLETYDTQDTQNLKILEAYQRNNYGYYWYTTFSIVIGLTLLPLSKGKRK